MATTVLIVDDHPSFRASARMLLESEGFDVVGEAGRRRAGPATLRASCSPTWCCSTYGCRTSTGSRWPPADAATDAAPAVVLVSSRARED